MNDEQNERTASHEPGTIRRFARPQIIACFAVGLALYVLSFGAVGGFLRFALGSYSFPPEWMHLTFRIIYGPLLGASHVIPGGRDALTAYFELWEAAFDALF